MPATARPTHAPSHAGGQAGAKPKLYNPASAIDETAVAQVQAERDWATDLSHQIGNSLVIDSIPGAGARFSVVFAVQVPAPCVMPP